MCVCEWVSVCVTCLSSTLPPLPLITSVWHPLYSSLSCRWPTHCEGMQADQLPAGFRLSCCVVASLQNYSLRKKKCPRTASGAGKLILCTWMPLTQDITMIRCTCSPMWETFLSQRLLKLTYYKNLRWCRAAVAGGYRFRCFLNVFLVLCLLVSSKPSHRYLSTADTSCL